MLRTIFFTASPSILETWDFFLKSGTFLQFDLKHTSCIEASDDKLRLEYSQDRGKSYQLVRKPCLTGKNIFFNVLKTMAGY